MNFSKRIILIAALGFTATTKPAPIDFFTYTKKCLERLQTNPPTKMNELLEWEKSFKSVKSQENLYNNLDDNQKNELEKRVAVIESLFYQLEHNFVPN